jgi:hypothetical protein
MSPFKHFAEQIGNFHHSTDGLLAMFESVQVADPINHELVMHWLRRGYNLMTENELSDAILIATGQRVVPNTLKKKRARLTLTARPPGPRPNSEQ